MGIYLHSTHEVVIADNVIKDDREGTYLYNSTNNHILNNIVPDNEYFPIQLFSSTLNNLINNTISHNCIGIYFYRYSAENIVEHNKIKEGGLFIVDSTDNKVLDNILEYRGLYVTDPGNKIKNNTLNGKQLIYLEGATDKVIEDAGQLILFQCSNITLRNLRIQIAGVAVFLWNTNSSRILILGILILHSSRNNIHDNEFYYNSFNVSAYNSTIEHGVKL
ncbi:MAG: NosD domain-containing protein [Nitrososphaerota archaeon]